MKKIYNIYLCSIEDVKDFDENNQMPLWCIGLLNNKNLIIPHWNFTYKKWLPNNILFNVPMSIRQSDFIIAYLIEGMNNTIIYNELMYAKGLQVEEYKTKKKPPKIVIVSDKTELPKRLTFLCDHLAWTFKDAFKWIDNQIEQDIDYENLNSAFG